MANLFSFNAQTETPATLAERRARAAILAGQIGGGAPSFGGGVGDLIRGLGAGLSRYRADRAEREGNAAGGAAMEELLAVLSQPPGQPLTTPGNDVVRSGLKTGLATGQVPQLATYAPGGPQNAGMPDTRPAPAYRPPRDEPEPVEEPVEPINEGQMPAAPMPGVQPAAMAPAGGDAALLPKLLAVLRNPWVTPADKALVQKRYDDIIQKMDPEYQYEQQTKRTKDALEIGMAKINLHNLQNPERKMEAWTDPNTGDLYAYDPRNPAGTKVLVQKAGPKTGPDDVKVVPKGARIFKDGKFLDEGPGAPAEIDVDNAIKVQKNFEGQPAMTNLQTIAPTLQSMLRSVDDPSAMADLDFVYGLAKILDPTSVVRESEAGMVIDSQGIAPQLLGNLNKMLSGQQTLNRATRLNLFKVAARRGQELVNAAKKDRGFAARQLKSLGVPEDDYLRPVPSVPRDQNMQAPLQAAAPAPSAQPAPGEPVWIIENGKPKRIQ